MAVQPTAKPATKPTVQAAARPATQTANPAARVPFTNPPFKILGKDERESSRYLKLLVYGGFGVGKTFLAGTAAEVASMNDVLLISAESGDLTLDSGDKPDFENIDSIPVTDYKTASEVYKFLQLHCKYRDHKAPEAEARLKQLQSNITGTPIDEIQQVKRYRTVIIDSLSEVEAYCMNQL